MEDLIWRSRVRIIAFCDFAISLIGIALLILTILAITEVIRLPYDIFSIFYRGLEINLGYLIVIYLLITLLAVLRVYKLFFDNLIINATSKETFDANKALEVSRKWRTLNVCLLAISMISHTLVLGPWWFGLGEAGVRLIFLQIVHSFISELNTRLGKADRQVIPLLDGRWPILLPALPTQR